MNDEDILLEYYYDRANNKAVLDVIRDRRSYQFNRTTYQFYDSDVTIIQTLEMFGINDPKITFNDAFRVMDQEAIDFYLSNPIRKLDVAQGVIHSKVEEKEESCYDHAVATGHTCINPHCIDCK